MSTNLSPHTPAIPNPDFWSPEIEAFLAEQTDFTALPFTLQLLSQAQGALFFLDAQVIYAEMQDGHVNSKFVSTEGVRSAFFYEAFDSGWMPPNIKRWGQTTKGRWAIQFNPPQKYQIELGHSRDSNERNPTKLNVTLPALIFMGYKNEYYVWAVNGEEFDPHAELYHLPVPNIYGEGRICFGGNTPPEVTKPNLDLAWDLFKRSPYNCSHAEGRSLKYPKHVCYALYDHVDREGEDTPYPMDDLFPYYMSVDDVVQKLLTGLPLPTRAQQLGDGMILHSFNEPEEDEEGFDEPEEEDEDTDEIETDEFAGHDLHEA